MPNTGIKVNRLVGQKRAKYQEWGCLRQ